MIQITDLNYLQTPREHLVLRKYTLDHASAIFALIDSSRAHLSQFRDETAEKYLTLQSVVDSIAHPTNPVKLRMGMWYDFTLVGSINLRPHTEETVEIGYYLGAAHTGKGYMVPCVLALTQHAFEKGFGEVFATVVPQNTASMAVLKRAQYIEQGMLEGKKLFSRFSDGSNRTSHLL